MRTNISRTRTSAVVALSAALALTLSACGGDDSTVSAPNNADGGSSSSAAGTVSAQHNDVDITFIKDMTPHHEGALAMAELAPDRAQNPRVKQLAEQIAAAQGPELELMQQMAKAWDVELSAGGQGGGHGGGMMTEDSTALEPLSGAAFDRAFLERMTAHHEGALPMARAEVDGGENPQGKVLAEEIIRTQTAEIAEMKQLLTQV